MQSNEIEPSVVGEVDRAFLAWTGRFRFVTAELLAVRFGVSVQKSNARICRLVERGVMNRSHRAIGSAFLVSLTLKGAREVGLVERRAPRGEVQRTHELAVVALAACVEQQRQQGPRVVTEREARQLEAAGAGGRFSVPVSGTARGDRLRWPDLVLIGADATRVAVEVELTLQGRARLSRILAAYRQQGTYADVQYRTPHAEIARRIDELLAATRKR